VLEYVHPSIEKIRATGLSQGNDFFSFARRVFSSRETILGKKKHPSGGVKNTLLERGEKPSNRLVISWDQIYINKVHRLMGFSSRSSDGIRGSKLSTARESRPADLQALQR
jgi:hypothetical protein